MGAGAGCMEEVAGEVVDFLYSCLVDAGSREPCNALVRCFKTHAYGGLPADLKALVREQMAGVDQAGSGPAQIEPDISMRCLVLLASRGAEPAWNGRRGSERHQVIPLRTAKMVEEAPMVARMVRQMGLEIEHVVGAPEELLIDLEQRTFNVFHVEEAVDSEYLPAQEMFVKRHGVRSVLGMGGLLSSGELFVVVMFSKVRITRETAALFRTLALSVKLVLLPFAGGRVFAGE